MNHQTDEAPTFKEFRRRLVEEYQCDCKSLERSGVYLDGEINYVVWTILREVPGHGLIEQVVSLNDCEPMKTSQIRSLCLRLGINPAEIYIDA